MVSSNDDGQQSEELRRIAYHLWVLAKMPRGGPDQFLDEARQVIARRHVHEGDPEQQPT